jgi:hypothetical protein
MSGGVSICVCCGRRVFVVTNTDLGPMHFDCWDRWHSSPSESYADPKETP